MFNELKKIIKSLKGSLVYVQVDNQILGLINSNDNLTEIYSLERPKLFNKKAKRDNSIELKKIKKKFKNKIDYMLCYVNGVSIDLGKIIYNTYKIIDKKIIYYGIYDEYDVDRIIKKYKRFKCNYNKLMFGNEFILEISMVNIRVSKLFIYKIIDFFIDIFEGFGNLLMG